MNKIISKWGIFMVLYSVTTALLFSLASYATMKGWNLMTGALLLMMVSLWLSGEYGLSKLGKRARWKYLVVFISTSRPGQYHW